VIHANRRLGSGCPMALYGSKQLVAAQVQMLEPGVQILHGWVEKKAKDSRPGFIHLASLQLADFFPLALVVRGRRRLSPHFERGANNPGPLATALGLAGAGI